jgi:hypothetical protein
MRKPPPRRRAATLRTRVSLDPQEVFNADEEPEEGKRRKSDETEDMDQTEVETVDLAAAQEARRSAQASVVRLRDPAAEAIRKRSEERRQRYRQSNEGEPQIPEQAVTIHSQNWKLLRNRSRRVLRNWQSG